MKKLRIALTALALAATAAVAQIPHQKVYATGDHLAKPMVMTPLVEFNNARRMPSPEYLDLEGKPAALPLGEGRLLIVNVWATWCEPCLKEIPELARLQEKYKGTKIEILGVSVDEDREKLAAFMKRHKLEGFKTLSDPRMESEKVMALATVPTNFIIDGGGNMVGYLPGYIPWNDQDVEPFLEKLAGKYADRAPDGSARAK